MPRWVPTPLADRLMFREFDDGAVSFDPDTTATLLLSPLSSFLLGLWRTQGRPPLTVEELLAQVLAVDDSSTDAALAHQMVQRALDDLQQAGLIATSAPA